MIVKRKDSIHKFEKQNLVTKRSKDGFLYDQYVCSVCGIIGKSYSFEYIELDKRFSKERMENCNVVTHDNTGKTLRVTRCNAYGPQFKALTPGSIHTIIAPPNGHDNNRGEWVMTTEAVLLLKSEYTLIVVTTMLDMTELHLRHELAQRNVSQADIDAYIALSLRFNSAGTSNTNHPLHSGLWALQDVGYEAARGTLEMLAEYLEQEN